MKKLFLATLLSTMLMSSVFSITWLEKLIYPVYTGTLKEGQYKVIEKNEDLVLIEVDGELFIIKPN